MGGRDILAAVAIGFVFTLLAPITQASDAPSLWGQPVVGIRLQCDANLKIEDFSGAITQRAGEPLERAKVAESLKNLYATGRFTDLRAEAEPEANGVDLVFVGLIQYFVGVLRVEGDLGSLEPRVLVTTSRLRLGQPLSDDILTAAHQRLADVLTANGYYQAHTSHRLERNPGTQEADILFSVSAGRPARLAGVEFQDHPPFPPDRLARVAGWRPGIHLTSTRLERGLFKLRQFYVARGRLQATVSIAKRVYDPKLHAEKLLVNADAGPLVRVRVAGAQISSSKLKELLPVFRDGVVDDTALAKSEQILEDYLQRKGFFSASVKAGLVSRAPMQTLELTFRVNLGARGEFVGYGIKGNRAIPSAELMAAISTPVQGLLQPPPVFSRQLLEQKTNSLAALYESIGFLDVRVTPLIDSHVGNRQGSWFVTFEIEEGVQMKVRHLTLNGVGPEIEKALWPDLLTKPSQPYAPERTQTDRDFILNYLADRGYAHATVAWHASPVTSQHQVDVEYDITVGPQERIQRILVLGNQRTRTGIVRRELAFRDGQPLNQSALLESQRQLYELGVFNQVQMATQELPDSETKKTVLVGVEEGRRWTVGYGGGFEVQKLGGNKPQGQFKASPRLSLDITRLNVGGRAQTFSMHGRLSNLEKGGGVGYLIPHLLNRHDLSLRINGLVDRSRDVPDFHGRPERRLGERRKTLQPNHPARGALQFPPRPGPRHFRAGQSRADPSPQPPGADRHAGNKLPQ